MNRIISNSVCNHCRLGIAQTSLALHSAKSFILITVFTVLTFNVMAQQKIVQTAGRTQLGEFAPEFAHLNDDILFYYCPLNPKTTPLTFRETEVWLSAYHGQAPFVKK